MKLKMFTDGGARGNPGPAGAGVVILDQAGKTVFAGGFFLGRTTNNVAEYSGLVKGLQAAQKLNADELTVCCDSELMVKQINGVYKVKSPLLKPLYQQACQEMQHFSRVQVQHVYRESNKEADQMANDAMDMAQDVGDAVAGVSAIPNDPAASPSATHSSNTDIDTAQFLPDKMTFLPDEPSRLVLAQGKNAIQGLICLQNDQVYQVNQQWPQTTLMTLQGDAQVIVNGTPHCLKQGSWIVLNGESAQVTPASGEKTALLLTAWK